MKKKKSSYSVDLTTDIFFLLKHVEYKVQMITGSPLSYNRQSV